MCTLVAPQVGVEEERTMQVVAVAPKLLPGAVRK
jgi:hypothetical protein